MHKQRPYSSGFTIVELLVVIVVIGILATVVFVAFSGASQRAITASLQADLNGGKKQIENFYAISGVYPTANNCTNTLTTEVCLKPSSGNTFTYTPSSTSSPSGYALSVLNSSTKQTAATSTSDPYFANVVALLKGDGSNGSTTITDSSPLVSSWTVFGNTQLSTAQYKYGVSSLYFDGSGDYMSVPYSSIFDLSSGDWTIETWFRADSFASTMNLLSKDTYGSNWDWGIEIPNSTSLRLWTAGTALNLTATVPAMSINTWYHIAYVRQSGTNTIYLNGVAYASNTMSITNASQRYVTVGAGGWNNPYNYTKGYIDDLRITKGVARYTSNFTPPGAL